LVEKWVQRFDAASVGWTLTKLDGNFLLLAMQDGSGTENDVASGELSIPTGTWVHFAAERQGDVITLYMNGAPVAQGTSSLNLDSGSSLKFGHRGSSSDTPGSEDTRGFFLNGRIDEVELFVGRALSGAEIQAIYNAGSAGKCKSYRTDIGHKFLQPINLPPQQRSSFKLGSTIPVKLQIFDASGAPISTVVASIAVQKKDAVADVPINETTLSTTPDQGTTFRYDPTGQQYIFNLSTKPLSAGTWTITTSLDDGSTIAADIDLRAK
jgi:hypothetical protein